MSPSSGMSFNVMKQWPAQASLYQTSGCLWVVQALTRITIQIWALTNWEACPEKSAWEKCFKRESFIMNMILLQNLPPACIGESVMQHDISVAWLGLVKKFDGIICSPTIGSKSERSKLTLYKTFNSQGQDLVDVGSMILYLYTEQWVV